jgi:hypothetical protein
VVWNLLFVWWHLKAFQDQTEELICVDKTKESDHNKDSDGKSEILKDEIHIVKEASQNIEKGKKKVEDPLRNAVSSDKMPIDAYSERNHLAII